MNEVERESLILNSAWKMIDGMVNWAMFVKNEHIGPTHLLFETRQHARLFIILLRDFLSQSGADRNEHEPLGLMNPPPGSRPSDLTFLFHLRQVCDNPQLGEDPTGLSEQIEAFARWLEGDFVAHDVNLADINVSADLRIERYRYIRMCGDIAKHNLAHLSRNVRYLHRLLGNADHEVSEQETYLAVENFFEWFFDNIFIYHSSHIAEFLNNIRWAIFEYLKPEYERSWHLTANCDARLSRVRLPRSRRDH